jgi:Ser-tRNA(Ala) deacylase AlaX
MNTLRKYLDDTYADSHAGSILHAGRDERGAYVVIDETIFYPQGGGQPADLGIIRCGHAVMQIAFVGDVDGEVRHYLAEAPADLDVLSGHGCELAVDKPRRLLHARLHTAGHVIAGLVDARRGPLRACKGFHFPEGPYVEFVGKPDGDADALLATLQAEIDTLLAQDPPVTATMVSFEELTQRCAGVPPQLPKDKPLRVVTIGQLEPVPCGGTHVASLAELQGISLLKMRSKKGNTKISYAVQAEA